ncbi:MULTISPECIES: hypothetical protein [Glutamicibacter]|jgi:hypothetical protein|uniref:Uncharacterized protein n=2 Tax=Glutamicibacter arilaitensis TaxID=256701 RepID=A0A2N7RZ26_9MICC|nr:MULTISPECIES: hypothetical protein [Glutamicibacter]PMQ19118.1 hypothetical protein CIK84_17420 [Glutamicibacter arilaitensis]TFH56295.1 hypothetical protein EXY26_04370 [Glutamicibacter arilaitensis]CBT76888.1 hypothetical protein AARI_26750 [Glutamicibacter arilaitensis Re117]HCH47644.1 hypothetical protein [Glutamicibacter sp.]HCJ55920.1 hypothetical protein [Glutamicibacter sp.]
MTKDFDTTEFAPQYGNDIYEPDDGRDSQAYEGSSDMPETMRNLDPLAQRNYLYDDDLETEDQLDNEFAENDDDDEETTELVDLEDEL